MVFERYIPPQFSTTRPKVTIRPSGLMSFDATAVEAFGLEKATHAVLFFDKNRKIIGVKLSNTGDVKGSIRIARRRRSMSIKAPQFLDSYGLALKEAQKFDARLDTNDDMININVKTIRRRRGRRPKTQ